ncbi:hypothetical protein Leryth_021688, partial [Lithospermum erythrorhizon]
LPQFQFFLRNNYVIIPSTNAITSPLHSPGNIVCWQQERGRARGHNNVPRVAYGRCSYEEDSRSIEHYSSGSSTALEYGGFNVHMSAPTSPFSSPINLSPRRDRDVGGGKDTFTSQYVATPCFQVWSAPDTMSSSYVDSSNHSYPCFNHNVSVENDQFIVDGSPIPITLISPRRMVRSPSCPLAENNSVSRRESHSPCLPNVHPLPRPPSTSPHSPLPHLSHITEILLVNSQWQKGKLIGRGTFGTVYVASNRETGALCAMKVVEMLPNDSNLAECIKQLEQEIKVLSNLKHPNIVQYYGSEIVGDQFNIYLEYVHPGSLTQFIKDHCGAITESVVRNFTRHILCGLAYLHSTKTIHRDIKGANLLVDAYGVVKLADFGMAKHLRGHKESLSLKGSPYWMAPELLHSEMDKDTSLDTAYAIDIWSLGCTVIEMLTGAPPWKEYEGAAALFMVLKENPPLPDGLSEDGRDFLNQCFRRNPTERPTAVMLLEHRFIRGNHQLPDAPVNIAKRPPVVNDSLLSRRGHRLPMFSDTQIMQGKSVAEQHR